ncbi:MAG: Rieske 2Fe-2S domain-containing protein [Betaproteobacteria bacterium]|nr:Rieske 2Fe-2S domain-containing protein [Betaproteobacteria bacterium]
MVDHPRIICASDALEEGAKGVRFKVRSGDGDAPAFAVRFCGKVYAYINRCAHVPVELDWEDGAFFDYSKLYLICATHGAMYLPESGVCVAGPCAGKRLTPLSVEERDGQIVLLKEAHHV